MTIKINAPSVNFGIAEKSRQWPQFLAVLSACLLSIGTGLHLGWITPAVPKLLSKDMGFELTNEEVSYVVMIYPLGYLIGSPSAGFSLDRIGRKYVLLLIAIPQVISWILIVMCQSILVLCTARFITGIADGALLTSLTAYIGEVCEPKVRGVIGSSQSLAILVGTLVIIIYGSYIPIRTSAYISVSVPLMFLITFIWMPESPYYFLMKNRIDDARNSLKFLRRMNNVENELSQISRDVQRQVSESGRLRDVFTIKSNLKGFFTLVGLRAFQQFSGMTAVMFYVQFIFLEANISGITPAVSSIICCGIQVMIGFCSSLIIDRFGRKPLYIFSCAGTAVLLFIMGAFFTFQKNGGDISTIAWIPIVTMMLYYMFGAVGFLTVPNVMAGELLSASVKPKALAVFHMYLGVLISGVAVIFQQLLKFGMDVPFYVFGVCAIVGILFCYFYVIETKGKTLEEIQQTLKGNSRSSTYCNKNIVT